MEMLSAFQEPYFIFIEPEVLKEKLFTCVSVLSFEANFWKKFYQIEKVKKKNKTKPKTVTFDLSYFWQI